MGQDFDAYYELLGIPPNEQPPNYYRLLGLALFEANPSVISNACSRQMRFVRTLGGEYADFSQKILNELGKAKLCLINPAKRAAYDETLRGVAPKPVSPKPASQPATPHVPPRASLPAAPRPPAPPKPLPGPAKAPAQAASQSPPDLAKKNDGGTDVAPVAVNATPPAAVPASPAARQWTVGSDPTCELVVDEQSVSRRHCRLTREGDHLHLEDLLSTNGTFVNGRRVRGATEVSPRDRICLGKNVRMPWPTGAVDAHYRVLHIGRMADNDLVLDHPTVSGYHARLIVDGTHLTLEDLGSSNGTAVGNPTNRVKTSSIAANDVVYFGTRQMPVQQILELARPRSNG